MTINECIKDLMSQADESKRIYETHISYYDKEGKPVYLEMIYCDDTEVINSVLDVYKNVYEKLTQIICWLEELRELREEVAELHCESRAT